MLSSVTLLFGGAAFLIWNTYRKAKRESEQGRSYEPEGRIRWEASDL